VGVGGEEVTGAVSDLVCGCRLTKYGGRLMQEWSSCFYNSGARVSVAKEVSGGCYMASVQA